MGYVCIVDVDTYGYFLPSLVRIRSTMDPMSARPRPTSPPHYDEREGFASSKAGDFGLICFTSTSYII